METCSMPTLESLGIDKLSDDEKQALIFDIYESMEEPKTRPELTPELRGMLSERAEHARKNPDDSIEAFELIAKMMQEIRPS
jgi:hypothetical protein